MQPFAFDPFPSSVVVKQEEKKSVTGRVSALGVGVVGCGLCGVCVGL